MKQHLRHFTINSTKEQLNNMSQYVEKTTTNSIKLQEVKTNADNNQRSGTDL